MKNKITFLLCFIKMITASQLIYSQSISTNNQTYENKTIEYGFKIWNLQIINYICDFYTVIPSDVVYNDVKGIGLGDGWSLSVTRIWNHSSPYPTKIRYLFTQYVKKSGRSYEAELIFDTLNTNPILQILKQNGQSHHVIDGYDGEFIKDLKRVLSQKDNSKYGRDDKMLGNIFCFVCRCIGNTVPNQKNITIGTDTTQLAIYDFGQIDGDIIDIFINDSLAKRNLILSKKSYMLTIKKNQEIILIVKNHGKLGDCTVFATIASTGQKFSLSGKVGEKILIKVK